MLKRAIAATFALAMLTGTVGCSSAYFSAMEKLGYAKRDLMVSRVHDAKDSQQKAKTQFKDALEQFRSVIAVKGGSLEQKYAKLSKELEKSENQAAQVKKRIASVEEVSSALFREWKSELKQYQNETLRDESERKLELTKDRYEQMIGAMKRASSKLDPALQPLRDNVLFLKHNLNAKAISSLNDELMTVESNVDSLVADLQRSIDEADAFIGEMKKE